MKTDLPSYRVMAISSPTGRWSVFCKVHLRRRDDLVLEKHTQAGFMQCPHVIQRYTCSASLGVLSKREWLKK